MVFYINGVMKMRSSLYQTPTGNRTVVNVAEAQQLLYREPDSGGMHAPVKQFSLRPADLFAKMDCTNIQEEIGSGRFMDTRNLVTERPMLSRRSNAVPTQFLSNVFENYRKAQALGDFGQSEDMVLSDARGNIQEPSAQNNYFINAIAQRRGETMTTSWFTWDELCGLDPNVQNDRVTQVIIMGSPRQVVNTDYNNAGQSRPWGDSSTRHPQVASSLSQSIPSIMMELGLSEIAFHATNRTVDGQPAILVSNYNSFAGLAGMQLDMTQQIELFRARLWDRILRGVSFNGQVDFAISGTMHLLGESILEIQLLDNEVYRFAVPSFQDALLSPLVTVAQNRPMEIASDFQQLFGQVLQPQHQASFLQQAEPQTNFQDFNSVFGKI